MRLSRLAGFAVAFAALNGLSAVALGAWAAHGLGAAEKDWIETASRYQMWHALAIMAAALVRENAAGTARALLAAAILAFGLGIVLFCGALVSLGLGSAGGGAGGAAPFGGTAFLIGWALFAASAIAALRGRKN
jgi:uncharacterized membrane protein YgdD (TMEM256/DUF423 family)